MAGIPPWLDFSPQTFVGAAEAGQRLRQGEEQIGLERQRLAQSAAQAMAEIGARNQSIAAAQQENAIKSKLAQDELQNNFLIGQTKLSIADAYNQSKLGLEKNKVEQLAQDKAAQLADRQNYAKFLAGGGSPAEGISKFPMAWTSGIGNSMSKPAAGNTQTMTTTIPAETAVDADVTPGVPAVPGYERSLLNPARYLSGVNVAAIPAIPAVTNSPAKEAHPAYTVSRKIPATVSPADAYKYATGTSGTSGTPDPKPQTQDAGPQTPAPKEVIRLTKEGKRAVFNADTKKFLRYAD